MPVRFVLGRAGTGKTHACLQEIAHELARPGDERLILLVPEQAGLQMERALAARTAAGGYWRAEVTSFTRLARRLIGECGAAPPLTRPAARTMILRRIAGQTSGCREAFGVAADMRGFYARLDQFIEEVLSEDVSPADLAAAVEQLPAGATREKLGVVSRVYGAYLDSAGEERLDAALHLLLLRRRLAEIPWLRSASIWVDGFAGFTGQEFATLTALAQAARRLTVSLLVDADQADLHATAVVADPLRLFHRTEATFQRLHAALRDAGLAIEILRLPCRPNPRFVASPSLAALEARLAGAPPSDPPPPRGALRVLACSDHRDELRRAARWIRRSIVESRGALRFADFALVARSVEPFAALAAAVLEEFDIPYFIDVRRPLRSHALARCLLALLEAARDELPPGAMMRLLRTGLLPLSRHQAEWLESIVAQQSLRGRRDWGATHWRPFRPDWFEPPDPTDEPHAAATPAAPRPTDLARMHIAESVGKLCDLAQRTDRPTGEQWARELAAALRALEIDRRTQSWIDEAAAERRWEEAEWHRLAWETLCDVLDDVGTIFAHTPLAIDELYDIVATALEDSTLGLAPPTLDQVLVGGIERSRHPDIRHVWLFAFNDGIFPATPADDAVFSESERRALLRAGLPALRSRRDDIHSERLLAYVAATRASQSLTISFARCDAEGAALAPSSLLAWLAPQAPEQSGGADNLPAIGYPNGAPSGAAARQADWDDELPVTVPDAIRMSFDSRGGPAATRHAELVQTLGRPADSPLADLVARLTRGAGYTNLPVTRPLVATEPGGPVWSGSVSQLETHVSCPFKHLAEFRLRLDTRRGPRPIAWDLGSAAHRALAEVFSAAIARPDGARDCPEEAWCVYLERALEKLAAAAPDAARRPDLRFMLDHLGKFLREVVRVHAERLRRGALRPWLVEVPFGGGVAGEQTWIELPLASGATARIEGKIDRVDRVDSDGVTHLLIYDYKTSADLPPKHCLVGPWLQLGAYLMALDAWGAGRWRVAGGLIAPLRPGADQLKTDDTLARPEIEQLMFMYQPRGMFARALAEALDSGLGVQRSPVAMMRRKKSGELIAKSDARRAEDIAGIVEAARATFSETLDELCEGGVAPAPLLHQRRLTCRVCEFQAVCRFDRAYNRPRDSRVALPRLDAARDVPEDDS
ncbi:MAG: ATP-dependent helicase/deoxyribonuclease subunit B [Phycisphaerae bacterium]|nr:ATP-dependent helicase/deoxyribonuclease subunit B [Phycisphaerae bacterium]